MKKSFSLYSIYSLSEKTQVKTDTKIGSLENFILTYNPTWKPTNYQKLIGETITHYVDLAKQNKKRYFIFIVVPPQHGKSALVSGHYPAYHLSKYPSDNILLWTHSISLSSDFSYSNREILMNNDLPAKLLVGSRKGRSGLTEWKTSTGGGLKGSGLGSRVTGKGYELIICDDLFPGESEALSKAYNIRLKRAWDSSISKRLRTGAVVLFPSVRYGNDDLLGYVQKQVKDAGLDDRIVELNFPAIAEENDILGRKKGEALSHLFPIETLLDIKATTPPHLWMAQYCGKPTQNAGLYYSPEYFIHGREEGEFLKWTIKGQDYLANKKNCRFFQFWDTSVKVSENSDDSACVTVAYCKIAGIYFVIIYDVWKKQLNTSQLLPALKEQYRKHPYVKKIFIEQAVSGYGLLESALAERFPVAPIKTRQKSKEDRAIPMQSLYMALSVIHIASKNQIPCEWLQPFEDAELSFPNGKVDTVDAGNYSGNALIHDLMILRGDLKEEPYGILGDTGQIAVLDKDNTKKDSFSDRIFSRSQKYFSDDE